MNDTITPREARILNTINAVNGISRKNIEIQVSQVYSISKPTLIRDLNKLLKLKLIRIEGKGPTTLYYPFENNPLFKKFDLNSYFAVDLDQRLAQQSFNFNLFKNIKKLFTSKEENLLEQNKRSYSKYVKQTDPSILKRELERFTIELAWKSSKIEGNTYSLLETEALVKDNIKAKGKKKEETTMILNHKTAFELIMNNISDFKMISLTRVNQLHNILVKDLNISTGIREHEVGITGTVYQPLANKYQITEALEKTIVNVNTNKSPLGKSFIMHFMLPYIQPYADGNKRTARMLTNAILLAYDYYPLSYRSVNEEEFKKALIIFYEQNSIVHIKRLFIEQYIFANNTYFKY